ncbi:hypothetical protein M422DRAFT_40549 [Sphaerobolus stellatus SS14]|nr:hypothetical protein M422DRAFT_40549 [Sphaerobolus stellatus SS14]
MSPKFKRNDKVKLEPSASDTLIAPTRWSIEKRFPDARNTPRSRRPRFLQFLRQSRNLKLVIQLSGLQQAAAEKRYHYRLKAEIQTKYTKRAGTEVRGVSLNDIHCFY